jgi:hypothetical protein
MNVKRSHPAANADYHVTVCYFGDDRRHDRFIQKPLDTRASIPDFGNPDRTIGLPTGHGCQGQVSLDLCAHRFVVAVARGLRLAKDRARAMPGFDRLGLPAVLMALWTCSAAHAQSSFVARPSSLAVQLTWNGPAGCPSRDEVLGETSRILGPRGTRADRAPAIARVDVRPVDGGGWLGVLRVDAGEAHGERRFEGDTCAAIASAAALILAVFLEEEAYPTSRQAPGIPTLPLSLPVAVPVPSPGVVPGGARDRRPTAAQQWHRQLAATAAGSIDAGTMPSPAVAGLEIGLGVGLEGTTWRLGAQAGFADYSGQTVVLPSTGGGRFSLLSVSARGCAAWVRGRLELGPCLGAEIERMGATGSGPVETFTPGSAERTWATALAGGTAGWRLSHNFMAFARAEAVLSPTRTRFVLTPGNVVVHEPSRVAGRFAVGLEMRFF